MRRYLIVGIQFAQRSLTQLAEEPHERGLRFRVTLMTKWMPSARCVEWKPAVKAMPTNVKAAIVEPVEPVEVLTKVWIFCGKVGFEARRSK